MIRGAAVRRVAYTHRRLPTFVACQRRTFGAARWGAGNDPTLHASLLALKERWDRFDPQASKREQADRAWNLARVTLARAIHPAAILALATVMTAGALTLFFEVFRERISGNTSLTTTEVTTHVLNDPRVQRDVNAAAREVVRSVLRNDDTVTEVVSALQRLIQREEAQGMLADLAVRTLSEKQTVSGGKRFVVDIFDDDWMQDRVTEFSRHVTRKALKDGELKESAKRWMSDVFQEAVREPSLQAETGVALRNAALHGVGGRLWSIPHAQPRPTIEEEVNELRVARQELVRRVEAEHNRANRLEEELFQRLQVLPMTPSATQE
eukprot:Hpha_TRINITY_DN15162_c1_g4::TRINITY_DN15162_c1_g4_i1::g.128028::m.128028